MQYIKILTFLFTSLLFSQLAKAQKQDFLQLGDSALSMENYAEAISFYDKDLEMNGGKDSTYFLRGFAKARLKLYSAALLDYNEALRLSPQFDMVYYNRAFVKIQIKQYIDAIVDCDNAIRINCKYPINRTTLN